MSMAGRIRCRHGAEAMYTGEGALPEILYRGVAPGTVHDIQQATGGAIIPRGGTASALAHAEGFTDSPFTSWTSDINVARRFAGPNGVIFKVEPLKLPNEIIFARPFSPKPYENEYLIRGPISRTQRLGKQ
jgi:hypothetical protein